MDNFIIFDDAADIVKTVDFSFLQGKTVLVTGATGLIGTYILATLAQLDRLGASIEVFAECHSYPSEHTRAIAQAGHIHLVEKADCAADVILHAAGYAPPNVFTINPAETIRINTAMTQELLDRLKPGGKFLFVSSSEVYNGVSGSAPESAIGNTTPLHPRACYIEGKRCGEAIINAYRQAGVDAKSARLCLAYGPGTRKHDQRAMSVFIEQALTTGALTLKYSGREPRTLCYVSDAMEMMWNICLHGTQPVYNVGGVSVTSMAEVAERISWFTGASLFIPEGDTKILGAPPAVSVDITRYKTEFGKTKFLGLEAGLNRMIDWQRGLYESI